MRLTRIRRLLAILLVVIGVLEVVYVAAGSYLVRSGQVERWINEHPEKVRVSFDSVWTILPGLVHFRGVRIVQQGRGSQLEAVVDRGWGVVGFLELPARRIHVVGLRAQGVEFRLRRRPKTAEEAAGAPPARMPPIDGAPWEPWAGPPPGPRKPAKWAVVFTGARLSGIREVWIDERRITGPGTVGASVTVGRDKRISIGGVDVRFEGAVFGFGQEEVYSDLTFRLRGGMGTEGRLPAAAALLNYYLGSARWVRFTGGGTRVTARLGVEGGRLRPGSHVELAPMELRAGVAGFTAVGTSVTRLLVAGEDDASEVLVDVGFESYGLLRHDSATAPVMRGEGLRIGVRAPANLESLPPPDFTGRIDLGKAEFPDLAFANEFFPGGGGVRVKRGTATAEGAFDVADGGTLCKGSMRVTGEQLVIDAGGVETRGAFSLEFLVPRGDLLTTDFRVDGTRLELDRFSFGSRHEPGGPRDWRGSIAFPEARLDMSGALAVEGRVDVRASDTRPLVAFLSADKPLKGWKKRLLSVEEITGGGRFRLGDGNLDARDFRVAGGPVEIQARAKVTEKGAFGKVLARYGMLKAGIELKGQERSLHVIRPGHWFEER